MSACMYVGRYVGMYVCLFVYIYIYTFIQIQVLMYKYVFIWIFACINSTSIVHAGPSGREGPMQQAWHAAWFILINDGTPEEPYQFRTSLGL